MKTVKSILFLTAIFLSADTYADAYKCMKGGRPVYQGTPCEINSEKGKLDIKEQTPEQKAMALEKLQEVRDQYDASQAKDNEARSAASDAMRQSLDAQYRQTNTQQPAQPRYPFGDPRNRNASDE